MKQPWHLSTSIALHNSPFQHHVYLHDTLSLQGSKQTSVQRACMRCTTVARRRPLPHKAGPRSNAVFPSVGDSRRNEPEIALPRSYCIAPRYQSHDVTSISTCWNQGLIVASVQRCFLFGMDSAVQWSTSTCSCQSNSVDHAGVHIRSLRKHFRDIPRPCMSNPSSEST